VSPSRAEALKEPLDALGFLHHETAEGSLNADNLGMILAHLPKPLNGDHDANELANAQEDDPEEFVAQPQTSERVCGPALTLRA